MRGDYGISYELELIRLIEKYRENPEKFKEAYSKILTDKVLYSIS